ncbi:MAG: 1,4-dihydroxy-6-naphthoate synthase [Bacteroidetes bacterium]|nr:1,4-dihydroxy-6-naphthoate synthase [Bacteroidota bacterium]
MMIRLAFSPCPNDTFIFDALVHGKIDLEGLDFDFRMEDVETLNLLALKGQADMIKVSYHAYLYLQPSFVLLQSGSALGRGNGPLLIAKKDLSHEEIPLLTIAIPGEYTTAHLLFRLAFPDALLRRFMVFNQVEEAVLNNRVDAGVIIHENRFTYQEKGLKKIADLGEFWESLTHAPIPLGGIVAKRSLGYEVINKLNRIMHRSVEYAMVNGPEAMPFVRANAQEMDEKVMMKHIGLYVNNFTLQLGDEGKEAVSKLLEKAKEKKLIS